MKKTLLAMAGLALGTALVLSAGCSGGGGTVYTGYSPYPVGYTGAYYYGGYGRHYHTTYEVKRPTKDQLPARGSVGRPERMPSRPPSRPSRPPAPRGRR